MCRVTRKHVWDHYITTQELGQRLGVETIDTYINRRQLRWTDHVRRMWTMTAVCPNACFPLGSTILT
jgi:hypothetical protein